MKGFSGFSMIPSSSEDESSKFIRTWKSNLISCSILTSSFYLLQMVSQRFFGVLRLHSGLPNPVLSSIGCMSTMSMLFLSQNVEQVARQNRQLLGGFGDHLLPLPKASQKHERRDHIKRMFLSTLTFVLLEQRGFRTAFPSSIISLGVFGNLGRRFRLSVATDSALTTAAQREAIQKLGKRFGCHHCGSRQVFTRKVFIADHMPPTKIAEKLSRSWWRRLLKRPIQQRLWPQCFKCYSIQGQAVKNGVHVIAYHNVLKSFHFSPAVAFLLMQDPQISNHFDQMIDPVINQVEQWIRKVEKALK